MKYDLKTQLLVNAAALYGQGRHQDALDICLQVARDHPTFAQAWIDATVNCAKLSRWQDVIHYGQTALACGGNTLGLYDALTYTYGHLKQWNEVRRYGLRSLNLRAQRFGKEPSIPPPTPISFPPPPSMQTRERNIIAFSLFGGNPKYCEAAVLNVLDQPHIYPHWTCRFYLDDTVPEHVIVRLRSGGAQIVRVEGPTAQWPGPMWRFLALDDPHMHRVLFRDADSVISQREAGAVDEWLASDKRFHAMRDYPTHTELLMAGLWGAVGGSLPSLEQLMQRFLSVPLESAHFADQYFLRQYVWPYARVSLMQHDSMFGFMDGVPFPDKTRADDLHVFHVGYVEGSSSFVIKTDLPDGSVVTWRFLSIETPDNGQRREQLVCAYPGTVKNGEVAWNIPARYARQHQQGTARIEMVVSHLQEKQTHHQIA